LDLVAHGPDDTVDGRRVVENFPHGQLLVAGWGTIEPAVHVRRLAAEHALYVETFLGAAYAVGAQTVVAIVPLDDAMLPAWDGGSVEELKSHLPANSVVLTEDELPRGHRRGTPQSFGEVMALWERLHTPFLAAADVESDPVRQIEGYRLTARVDYASELAHQRLSNAAHELAREARNRPRA
jgi:hypothetical protein